MATPHINASTKVFFAVATIVGVFGVAARARSQRLLSEMSSAAAAQSSSSTTAGGFKTMPPPRPLTNADLVLAKIVNGKLALAVGITLDKVKKALHNLDASLSPDKMEAALIKGGLLKPVQKLVPVAPKPSYLKAFQPAAPSFALIA